MSDSNGIENQPESAADVSGFGGHPLRTLTVPAVAGFFFGGGFLAVFQAGFLNAKEAKGREGGNGGEFLRGPPRFRGWARFGGAC